MNSDLLAFQGPILHYLDDPTTNSNSYEYYEDGILIIKQGKVHSLGTAKDLLPTISKAIKIYKYDKKKLIMPGFIDTHVHFAQKGMIASYGEQLLEWLDKYTFPHEKRFDDKEYALNIAELFIKELLRNGTTTALVFATASKESVEALFETAQNFNMRIISGMSLVDRNVPAEIIKPLEQVRQETKTLIEKWDSKGRTHYAISPRFAPTSSEDQLKMIEEFLKQYPNLHVHTHLSENMDEIAWVKQLFPWSKNYLDVYDHFGLVRPKAMFAHAIHLSDDEISLISQSKAAVSFCPTSNLFLGSGLFPWKKYRNQGLLIGMGTDIGAGTSFSMFHTAGEGYKIAQLQKTTIHPLEAFYCLTLGGAKALYLDQVIGNFEIGKEADVVVLDLAATPLLSFRMRETELLRDKLFLLMMLGDDRNILETYVMGKRHYQKTSAV